MAVLLCVLEAASAQAPSCPSRAGLWDPGQEVQGREGASQSVHPIRLAGGHSPTALAPRFNPQSNTGFHSSRRASVAPAAPTAQAKNGGSIPHQW